MKNILLILILLCLAGCTGPLEGYKVQEAKLIMECVEKGGVPMHNGVRDGYSFCAYKEAK